MVKEVTTKTKSSVKKKSAQKDTTNALAAKKVAGKVASNRKVQAVKRVVQKVPKKKVSILVLVVLAMASVVTVAWLFDKV